MNFKQANNMDANGTCLQGEVLTNYAKLVKVFGEPTFGPDGNGDKTTCEWVVKFKDGTVATIYDWKLYSTPFMDYHWHIGGFNYTAVERVLDALA